MPRKPKFRPVITRVKLNPEQAVLTCMCYDNSLIVGPSELRELGCAGFEKGATLGCAELEMDASS